MKRAMEKPVPRHHFVIAILTTIASAGLALWTDDPLIRALNLLIAGTGLAHLAVMVFQNRRANERSLP